LAYLVTDANRFAGLGQEWFWTEVFHLPESKHWYIEHAETVSIHRKRERLSFEKLAKIYGVSKPTIAAAVKHYLETHPGVKDEVRLGTGGSRRRHDVEPIADEVRRLWWVEHWSKLMLARKFECSETTINRALKVAYGRTGEPVPSNDDRRQHQLREARRMLEAGYDLEGMADGLHVSGNQVRVLLKESFAAEGKSMPDLRRRENKPRTSG
jgi:hypothetical protein